MTVIYHLAIDGKTNGFGRPKCKTPGGTFCLSAKLDQLDEIKRKARACKRCWPLDD